MLTMLVDLLLKALIKMFSTITEAARNLFPGYFALVMATGAMAVAANMHGIKFLDWPLLFVNASAYVLLWLLTLLRIGLFPSALISDLRTHAKAPGFFTIVAGTCVLGAQILRVTGCVEMAASLWVIGLVLWTIVMYAFFFAVMTRSEKPELETGINGAWLLAAVGTQSLAVLGAMAHTSETDSAIQLISISMFLLGSLLYLSIITLIMYRMTFIRLTTAALTPPYWINMGAVAISTLAGSTLLLRAPVWPLAAELGPFIRGFTLLFWVAATWWIPLLLALGIWKFVICRAKLYYDPQLWGMVFPLAMYAAGTYQLTRIFDLDFLESVSAGVLVGAALAWTVVAAGLVGTVARVGKRRSNRR